MDLPVAPSDRAASPKDSGLSACAPADAEWRGHPERVCAMLEAGSEGHGTRKNRRQAAQGAHLVAEGIGTHTRTKTWDNVREDRHSRTEG